MNFTFLFSMNINQEGCPVICIKKYTDWILFKCSLSLYTDWILFKCSLFLYTDWILFKCSLSLYTDWILFKCSLSLYTDWILFKCSLSLYTDCILCTNVRLHHKKKQVSSLSHWTASDGQDSVLELWGISSTPLLLLLPDTLWPGMAAPIRVS